MKRNLLFQFFLCSQFFNEFNKAESYGRNRFFLIIRYFLHYIFNTIITHSTTIFTAITTEGKP